MILIGSDMFHIPIIQNADYILFRVIYNADSDQNLYYNI